MLHTLEDAFALLEIGAANCAATPNSDWYDDLRKPVHFRITNANTLRLRVFVSVRSRSKTKLVPQCVRVVRLSYSHETPLERSPPHVRFLGHRHRRPTIDSAAPLV